MLQDSGAIPTPDSGWEWQAVPIETNDGNGIVFSQTAGKNSDGNVQIRVRVANTDISSGKYLKFGTWLYLTNVATNQNPVTETLYPKVTEAH